MVKLNRTRGRSLPLFKANGKINDKLPKTIKESLDPPAEEIVETNKEEIARRNKKISEIQDRLKTIRIKVRKGNSTKLLLKK